jgi:hypothetical protein
MNKQKKIFLWFAGATSVFTILLLTLWVLAPRFINRESLKEKVISSLSEKLEGKIDLQEAELSFFPRPHIIIHQVRVFLPKKAEGTIQSLKFYPKILPLLAGEIHIAKMLAEYPDFSIWIQESKKKLSIIDIEEKLSTILNILETKAPGLDAVIKKGKLNISQNSKINLSFQNIDSRIVFPPRELKYNIITRFSNSDSIALSGCLDPKSFKGKGSMYLKGSKLSALLDALFPDIMKHVAGSEINLKLTFQTDGIGILQSEVEGSIPFLALQNGNKKVIIEGRSIKANLGFNEEITRISLLKLEVHDPGMTLTGSLRMNNNPRHIDLLLTGKEVDVNELRNTAIALAGDTPLIKAISDYVRGGKVPLIMFRTQGVSLDDLGKSENIVVQGRMYEGEIFIPGPDLAFKAVRGDCVISKGILEASQIQARLENAQLSEGSLRVGLIGKDAPLHLETLTKVHLSELLPLLKRLLKNEPLLNEFNLIRDLSGNAQGKLVLGETIDSIQVAFDVSKTKFSARYTRIPYPIEINEGSASYYGKKINVKNLSGTLGTSSFSKLTGTLHLEKPYHCEISSGKSSFALEEIYSWVSSYEVLKSSLKNITSLWGTLFVSSINVNGPLLSPEKLRFHIRGSLNNIALSSPLLPGTLSLTSRTFVAIPGQVSLTEARTNLLDASVILSGFFKGNFNGIQKADIALKGTARPSAIRWIKDMMKLPPEFRIPQALSLSQSHLIWEEPDNISIQGTMKIKDGPDIDLDINKNVQGLIIKKLCVKDGTSRATLSFSHQEKKAGLAFAGILTRKTVDKLIMLPDFPGGSIKGDFRVEIQIMKPAKLIAQGRLDGEKILIPWRSGVPIKIGRFSLSASANVITVETNSLIWGNNIFSLKGDLNSTDKGIGLDMDVSAENLEWNSIKQIMAVLYGEDKKGNKTWESNIRGIVRFKSKTVTFDRFTVSPFHADIALAGNAVNATITKAVICTIPTSGSVSLSRNNIQLKFKPVVRNQDLEPFVICLLSDKEPITGHFDLQGELSAQGKLDSLARTLNGNLVFTAKDGRIYKYGTIAKILAFLNITEIFHGELPDIVQEGFAYQSIFIKGKINKGKLLLKEAIIDGSSMEIVSEGDIDLIEKKVNLKVLVSPLKTLDFVLRKIPLISDITGRSLISIPIKVTGDLGNPEVTYLPLSSVGSGLLGILERTIKLPVKIIQPLLPSKDKKQQDEGID